MTQADRSDSLSGLFTLAVLGAIAAVLVGLWQLSPPLPTGMLPLEAGFRNDVSTLFGGEPDKCRFNGQKLVLYCRAGPVSQEALLRNLRDQGWTKSASPGPQMLFNRNHDSLKLLCGAGDTFWCDLELRRWLAKPA